MLDAKTLAEYLLESDISGIKEIGDAIIERRRKTIAAAKNSCNPESSQYFSKHIVVALIKTDNDFFILDQDTNSLSNDVALEFVADSKHEAISLAHSYLVNLENYGESRNNNVFIEDYVKTGLKKIAEDDLFPQWESWGNWEIEFSYRKPDSLPPDQYEPTITFMDKEIPLLTNDELIELGFRQ